MAYTLSQQMARTAGIFQALVAIPVMVVMGELAFLELFYPYIRLYDFITDTTTSLMAVGIIFIVIVQRKLPGMSKVTMLHFEIAKSALATGLWLWLLLDSIFGPERSTWRPYRQPRIIRAAISVVVLFILVYPTLVHAIIDVRSGRTTGSSEESGEEGQASEETPLLAE